MFPKKIREKFLAFNPEDSVNALQESVQSLNDTKIITAQVTQTAKKIETAIENNHFRNRFIASITGQETK